MITKTRVLSLSAAAAALCLGFGAGSAAAEEPFSGWGTVPAQELSAERGMAFEVDESALAKAVGAQHQTVTITGDVNAPGGDINFGTHTFDGQVMSLNIVNSGHNNVFQAQNVIAVTVVGSP